MIFIVGIITITIVFISKRYFKKIPASLVAIAGGTSIFYAIAAITGYNINDAIIGSIQARWPDPLTFHHLVRGIGQIDFTTMGNLCPEVI